MRAISLLVLLCLSLGLLAACTPTPAPPAAPPVTPATVEVSVYFTDLNRFNAGTPPFESAVTRQVTAGASLPEAVLAEFFKGPTAAEQTQGLTLLACGFTGYSSLEVQDGIAHLHLSGPCITHGAAYTIASPLIKNLLQFSEIQYVKIYDEAGDTADPSGPNHSIPACLEP